VSNELVLVPAAGTEVLYRLARGEPATVDDFRGRRDLSRDRRFPAHTPWVLLAGVSMFDTEQGALKVARRYPATIARVRLRTEVGIHLARSGGRGHFTIWGAPSVLIDCVEATDRAT
jgi:hypothetical protein